MNIKASLDDIAGKLPRIEFKSRKKKHSYYNQNMQSLRGGRQFFLRTYTDGNGRMDIILIEYSPSSELFTVGRRTAMANDPENVIRAIKSLERKAKCKLYYVLLISTDGEYL